MLALESEVNMLKLVYVVGASIVLAVPAAAQTVQSPQAVPVMLPADQTDVNKIVCERQEPLGSRLKGKKVCMTVEQWKQFHAENREKTEELQRAAPARPSG
jgi:hypothetical protein